MITAGRLFVEKEYRKGGVSMSTEHEEKALEPVICEGSNTATVEAKLGMTVSLGNFEFLRVDAGLILPCTQEGVQEAYDRAFSIAGEELFKRIEEARSTLV